MISNINNTKSNLCFKGISAKDIKRFIPNLTENSAQRLSYRFDSILPRDIIPLNEYRPNTFLHVIKTGAFKLPIGEIRYQGPESPLRKLRFLFDVAEKIQSNTLYK